MTITDTEPQRSESSFGSKLKTAFTTLLLMAIATGAGYGAAWWQGNTKLADQKANHDQQATQLQTQLKQANDSISAAQSTSQIMQARAALLQAAYDLDQRNFGNANTQVADATRALETITLSANPDQLKTLKEELSTVEINFVINPEEQKKRLLGFANQLLALQPR